MTWELVELAAAETYGLRRSVLRTGTPSDVVQFDGDDEPTTFHLGVSDDGSIVAVSSWMRRAFPPSPDATATQLRGMATEPAARGSGVSSMLLLAGVDLCRDRGDDLVWARARVAALTFYERYGFALSGEPYEDATTGLPHQDIVMRFS